MTTHSPSAGPDHVAAAARRLGARNGSPFAADRTFRRRRSGLALAFAVIRDGLAMAGLITILGLLAVALAAPLHWA